MSSVTPTAASMSCFKECSLIENETQLPNTPVNESSLICIPNASSSRHSVFHSERFDYHRSFSERLPVFVRASEAKTATLKENEQLNALGCQNASSCIHKEFLYAMSGQLPSIPYPDPESPEYQKELLKFILNSDYLSQLQKRLPSRPSPKTAAAKPFKPLTLRKKISKFGLVRKLSGYWSKQVTNCPVIFKRLGIGSEYDSTSRVEVYDLIKTRNSDSGECEESHVISECSESRSELC